MMDAVPVEVMEAGYPPVPLPMHPVRDIAAITAGSGVYFIWSLSNRYRDGRAVRVMRVAYVGQSINIASRIGRISASGQVTVSHPAAQSEDWLSYIPFSVAKLDFAEAYYIGLCMPWRNWPNKKRKPSGASVEAGRLQMGAPALQSIRCAQ